MRYEKSYMSTLSSVTCFRSTTHHCSKKQEKAVTYMLVVVRRDPRRHIHLVRHIRRLPLFQRVRINNARRLNLQLDTPVQRKVEVKAILVVCNGADGRNDQLAITRDVHLVVSEVGVLVQDAGVFFVDANGGFDGFDPAGAGDEVGVEVGDAAEAVAPEGERVGEGANTVSTPLARMTRAIEEVRLTLQCRKRACAGGGRRPCHMVQLSISSATLPQ